MTDRDAIHREVAGELLEWAETRAASRLKSADTARSYGKDDMATRAEAGHHAWMAVATELRVIATGHAIPEELRDWKP